MHKTDAPNRIGRALVLGACAALLLAGCKTEVYRGLTETQANAMMAVLLKNGIEPEKTSDKEGYAIAVESDRVTQTLELMRENNLPRSEFDTMGDVFAAKGMISSATEEKARMTYALSQELSDTFSRIDGVLTARVHVVLQTEDLATGKTTPASAAVFLRHTPDSQAPGLVARIRRERRSGTFVRPRLRHARSRSRNDHRADARRRKCEERLPASLRRVGRPDRGARSACGSGRALSARQGAKGRREIVRVGRPHGRTRLTPSV